jgi:flagellar biosynthesis/type III secretory pathway M-ring protein FliF/YscJ
MLQTVLQTATSATFFVQVALVLFLSVFVSVLVREAMRPRREVNRMADLPLADDDAGAPSTSASKDGSQ